MKCKCLICDKEFTNNNSYIGSHVKRVHKILLIDYVKKYYTNLTPEFKICKCGFCDNDAIPNYSINHIEHTYSMDYNDGYICYDEICRNNISIEILGHEYNKKSYEYIGSKSEYLSKKYKISIEDSKNMKYVYREVLTKYKSNLEGYILRYGIELGTIKYNERCKKIGYSTTKNWYVEKYGIEIGPIKWENFLFKLKNNSLGKKTSKASKIISNFLDELNIKYKEEYMIPDTKKYSDYFLPDYNIVIEYFGDYWHMNPKLYESSFFNKTLKVFAKDVWQKDRKRNIEIINNIKDCSLLIIWETSNITKEYLLDLINNLKNKKTILYI